MKYRPLLRKRLKSDEILDFLETYDMEVVYEIDRTHENMPDEYWTKCLELGLQLVFDENQYLKIVFINLTDADGFTPANLADSDVLQFDSKTVAASHAHQEGITTSEGRGVFLGEERDWIRFEHKEYSVHYEYRLGFLALVTLAAK